MIRYLSIYLIVFNFIYAQNLQDYDMDGVPDTIDVCSYTPFFDKVDKYGCSTKRLVLPEDKDNHNLDVIFSYGLAHNDDSKDREELDKSEIELNYYKNSWIYSLKIGYLKSNSWSDIDDTILSIKRHFQINQDIRLTTGIGIKLPTHDFEGNEVDYSFYENLNYYITDDFSIFLGGVYSIINDNSKESSIGNVYSYYFGIGYFLSKNLYANLSYSSTKSKFSEQQLIDTLSSTIFYQIDEKWFTLFGYSNEILDDDFHNSIDCKIGYSFAN